MLISITPVPKPRMTQSDRWKQRPSVLRYRAFCDELRLKYHEPYPEQVRLIFYMPVPASWSTRKKERMDGQPHQVRPDKDNLEKAVMDALCKDDSYVWDSRVTKLWSLKPGIDIEVLSTYEAEIS